MGVLLPPFLVQRMACIKDSVNMATVAMGQTDVQDAAMAVIAVVPIHELRHLRSGICADRTGDLLMRQKFWLIKRTL